MQTFTRDLRYGWRALRRAPWLSLAVVVSIGLGVGANTTVFAWIDNIVRNPFPGIPGGGALVAINVADRDGAVDGMPAIAGPVLDQWQARLTSFSGIAAHAAARLNLRSAPGALGDPVWVEIVAANFFETIGVAPALGRAVNPADAASRAPVVVLSHAFWQRRFGGDRSVMGRSILFNGVPLTVVGIAPPRFGGVVMGLAFDAWVPLWEQPQLLAGPDWNSDRTARRLQAVARLKPGVSLRDANRELLAVAIGVSRDFGESPQTGAAARWVSDTQLGSLMGPLGTAMLAVSAIVLITACTNVAGLMLARAMARQRQAAIQIAIGASRAHLVQQALVQSGMLALAGSVLGVWIAFATKDALRAFVPRVPLPVSLDIDLNWRVLAFAGTTAIVSMLLSGVVHALRGSRPDILSILKSSAGRQNVGRSPLRSALVAAQIACTLVSLSTAGLFLRSARAAGSAPLGFAVPEKVLLVSTDLSFTRMRGEALTSLVDRAMTGVRALPGVKAAALSTVVPLGFGGPQRINTTVDGYAPAPGESMQIGRAAVSESYFETMGIPIVEGRDFSDRDRAGSERVVIVNRAFVARYGRGQSGIGRRLDQSDGASTIVGVVGDFVVEGLNQPIAPIVFRPVTQAMPDAATLFIRTVADPLTMVEPIRRTLGAIHADVPVLDPGTLADRMRAGLFVQSVGSTVFAAFGLVALLVSATGLYGLVAALVAESTREIAVRVAVGAPPRAIIVDVVRPVLTLTAIGLAGGSILATALAFALRAQLIGVSPLDWASLAVSNAALVAVAMLACAWPARQALAIDPVAALRPE